VALPHNLGGCRLSIYPYVLHSSRLIRSSLSNRKQSAHSTRSLIYDP